MGSVIELSFSSRYQVATLNDLNESVQMAKASDLLPFAYEKLEKVDLSWTFFFHCRKEYKTTKT